MHVCIGDFGYNTYLRFAVLWNLGSIEHVRVCLAQRVHGAGKVYLALHFT